MRKKTSAKLDPKEIFIIKSCTRADVARFVNYALENMGIEERFTKDDPRLTNKICKAYAKAMSDMNDQLGDEADESAANITNHISKHICELLGFKEGKTLAQRLNEAGVVARGRRGEVRLFQRDVEVTPEWAGRGYLEESPQRTISFWMQGKQQVYFCDRFGKWYAG